ncbi:MAG: trypsin-like peptidase domain-containing protein [Acidobacteriota bacterium]|nr:trypsin-like peptidase domain-containing protein [Acidobacteriota bacterium]
MKKKAVYQMSARQILFLALASALIAVGLMACVGSFGGGAWQARETANVASAENTPQGITEPSTVSDEQNNIEVYRTLAPGVAFITSTMQQQDYFGDVQEGKGTGSGSVIDAQGHILTNYHVIEGARKLTVSLGGDKVYPAHLVGGDMDTDLAVIQIDVPKEGLTIIPMGDSDKLSVGQKVLAIGNPFGLDRTLTTGVISGLQRPIRAVNDHPIEGAIQTDASINPGNSGGPLLDKYGRMIGINSQILSRSGGSVGVGFAIPVSIAKRVIPQLIQFGEVRRPKLGASLESVEQLNGQVSLPVESGLLVRQVLSSGSAATAGIRGLSQSADGNVALGDIITSVDGEKMSSLDDLYHYLDKKQIGDTVQVAVYRNGRTLTIPVKLLPLPTQNRPMQRF